MVWYLAIVESISMNGINELLLAPGTGNMSKRYLSSKFGIIDDYG